MKPSGLRSIIIAAVSGLLAACGTAPSSQQTPYAPVVDPANFAAVVDNSYMPLVPGTTYVYDGRTEKGNEHNEVFVSADTKVILGVTCVVVKDTVTVDGALEEQTLDWYAQDKEGNVWYFGEGSKDFQNGELVGTKGSWEAGFDGAMPGIVMMANPAMGETYRQEYYQGEAEDWAEVLSLSEAVSVQTGSYQDVLMTNEWSGLDNPPVYEHKYYAEGIGLVMTKYVEGGFEMKLTEVRH